MTARRWLPTLAVLLEIAVSGDPKTQISPGLGGTAVPSEDFLYHLHRGSDLLMQDRIVEAKEELERALTHQPQDAKSQDLLAGVYFRLGVYPRAIELWRHLVEAFPEDPTLRVNLGLAFFKTGQQERALEHIHEALRLQPDHERAWGYLGLIHWRRGQLGEAREAFLRGGQASMAKRMEESLSAALGGSPDRRDSEPATGLGFAEADAGLQAEDAMSPEAESLRSSAAEALERMEGDRLEMTHAQEDRGRPSGPWHMRSPGEETVPRAPIRSRPAPAAAPSSLETVIGRWTAAVPQGAPLCIGPSGELHVSSEGSVFVRVDGVVATRGVFRASMAHRRVRGKDTDELLGGERPIMQWHGPIAAISVPPEGQALHGVTLEEGDVLFVREELLFAFEGRVVFESGGLPLAGKPVALIQLQGPGTVVFCVAGQPKGIWVESGHEVRVEPARLVGWTGRLLPGAARGTLPYAATAPALSFRGEGTVLLV